MYFVIPGSVCTCGPTEQAQDNRTCHQKAIEELKSGYEAQISELRTRFKSTADEYNSRLKHEMFPVLDEFQRLNIAVVEAEAEVASLRGLLEREKTECDRRHETERTLREQIASLSRSVFPLTNPTHYGWLYNNCHISIPGSE